MRYNLKRQWNSKNAMLCAYKNNVTCLLSELSVVLCGHSTNDVISALKKFHRIATIGRRIKKRRIQFVMTEKLNKIKLMISEFDTNAQSV